MTNESPFIGTTTSWSLRHLGRNGVKRGGPGLMSCIRVCFQFLQNNIRSNKCPSIGGNMEPADHIILFLAFPEVSVCSDPEWCIAKNDSKTKLNVVIVRFDPDEANFQERSEIARKWLREHKDTFLEMGE
jgi:hypothetical protein